MKSLMQKIPFPYLGYLFVLVGFVSLGLFVATLAHGMPVAWYLGVGTVAAYAAGAGCFRYRARQMRQSDPTANRVLHVDPMVPDNDRRDEARYLRNYRGIAMDDSRQRPGLWGEPVPGAGAGQVISRRVP